MQKRKKLLYILTITFVVLFIFAAFVVGKKIKQRWIVENTISSEHWQKRVKEIESAPLGKYKTIFLGNSLTEMWDVNYYFNDSTILNCGITGDFSEGLLQRTKGILRIEPDKLFIEIGINDMIEKIPLTEICSNYEKLIRLFQKEMPQTKIYIQSNLPVIINRPSMLTDDEDVNKRVIAQNKNLQQIATQCHCTYIDVYTEFAKEKDKASLFIYDGIHLTPKAYTIWTKVIKEKGLL